MYFIIQLNLLETLITRYCNQLLEHKLNREERGYTMTSLVILFP